MGEIGDRIADSCESAENDVQDFMEQLEWEDRDRGDTHHTMYLVSQDRVIALSMLGYYMGQTFSPMDSEDVEISIEETAKHAKRWSPCCWDAVPMSQQQVVAIRDLIAAESSRISNNEYFDHEGIPFTPSTSKVSVDDLPEPWLGYAEDEHALNEFSR